MTQSNNYNVILNDKKHNKPVCAVFTTSVWGKSNTLIPLMVRIISPTSKPLLSAGVFGSMAETTTGLEPWILNPNSPRTRITLTYLLHSARNVISYKIKTGAIFMKMFGSMAETTTSLKPA